MTEKEKMLAGQLYDPSDSELDQLRLKARKLARSYNLTDEDEREKQFQILKELPIRQKYPDCRLPSILIMAVIHILANAVWQTLILPVLTFALSILEIM